MFNVLPENLKQIIRTEYKQRFWIVSSVLVLGVELCAILFLAPSLVVSTYKEKDLLSTIAVVSSSAAPSITLPVSSDENKSRNLSIPETNQLLKIIDTELKYPKNSPYLDSILSLKMEGITIDQFSYTSTDSTHAEISLSGRSSTRESLASFVKSLKASKRFSSVDLPVSNLAKDKNIDFSISIKI
jgi:hypothetical protein